MRVLNQDFDHRLESEEHASQTLAGGILQHGFQCGMLWGATLAAGAEACRRFGACPEAEARAMNCARRLVDTFQAQNHHTDCFDITNIDKDASALKMIKVFLIEGKTVGCLRMAARYAPVARREIEAALAEPAAAPHAAPVSCAAEMARRLGASDLQAVMAAGLAGGIGLSGGACGALGTAIWIDGMRTIADGGKPGLRSGSALDVIRRFLAATDYEFECTQIVGRKFSSVGDHAGYLREGGCGWIIDAMAAGSAVG